jgi:hypothetical protein
MTVLRSIRVLVAIDGLAGDLLERRLRGDVAFEVVGRTPAELARAMAQRSQPDFVIIPFLPDGDDPVELLDAVPRMKVLAIETVDGHAYLTELLRDVSPDDVAEALRRAVNGRED